MGRSDSSGSIFDFLSEENKDTPPSTQRSPSPIEQRQLPVVDQTPSIVTSAQEKRLVTEKHFDPALLMSARKIMNYRDSDEINTWNHTASSFLNNSSTVTHDSSTSFPRKKSSMVRQDKYLFDKRNSKAKTTVEDGFDPSKDINTKKASKGVVTGLGFLSNNPSAFPSIRSDDDSNSSGSFDTYESSSYSQSTLREDGGFFGDIMAASEKAFGTVAYSLDMLFEEPYLEESEEGTIDTGSPETIPNCRSMEDEDAFTGDAFVGEAFAEESSVKELPTIQSSLKNKPPPKPKGIIKKRYQIPIGKHNFHRISANKDDTPGGLGISRQRSEEEIAADIMVKAVESWFGTTNSPTPSRVRFQSENNPTTQKIVISPKLRQTPSTDPTPQPQIPRREPKRELPPDSSNATDIQPQTYNTEEEVEMTATQAILPVSSLPPSGVGKKPDLKPLNPKTQSHGSTTMETLENQVNDALMSCQNQTTSQGDQPPTPQMKTLIPQAVKMAKTFGEQAGDQTRPRHFQVAKPVFGKGQKMRRSLGGIWRAHRHRQKDKKQTSPIRGKEAPPKVESSTVISPQDISGQGLAVSVSPETVSPAPPKRELFNTLGTQIVEKSFDMTNICGNRGEEVKKGSFGLIQGAATSEAGASGAVDTKQMTGDRAATHSPPPQSSENNSRELDTLTSDKAKEPSAPRYLPKSPSYPIANEQLQVRSPCPKSSASSKSMLQSRGTISSPTASFEPKRQGLLSAIRRKGKSLLNTEGKMNVDRSDGLKTTIIVTDIRSNLSPIRAGQSVDRSDDDEDSAIVHLDPLDVRAVDGEDGLFCSNVASELSNQCTARCSYRFQDPETHQPLCHSGDFSLLDGNTSVHPLVMGIHGQIESFIAGLTGNVPSNHVLSQAPSTYENGQFMICMDSGSAPHVQNPIQGVDKQDVKETLDTYPHDLELKIGPTFSLDFLEGALTQASKDLTDLADGVTQTEPRLTKSVSIDSGNQDHTQSIGDTGGDIETTMYYNAESSHGEHSGIVPNTTSWSFSAPKSKRKGSSARQISPPRPVYSVNEAPYSYSKVAQGKDYLDEEKSENTEWVEFGSKFVFHKPKLLQQFSHDIEEEKVSTPERRRRRRRQRKARITDLAFPVEVSDERIPQRDRRQFAC